MNIVDHKKAIAVDNLDIHVINSCNLRCQGCNHLANFGYEGLFTENELVEWINPWKNRLSFKRISLLGGEPLLNPHLKNICVAYRRLFPSAETKLRITTNGILINKCPWLKELIQEYNIHVQVSLHVLNGRTQYPKLIDQVMQGLRLIEKWAGETPRPVEYKWGPYVDSKQKLNFQVFYQPTMFLNNPGSQCQAQTGTNAHLGADEGGVDVPADFVVHAASVVTHFDDEEAPALR